MNPACPACATETTPVRLQDVPCFECAHCKGHFMRGDAVDRFLIERDVPNGQRRLIERALRATVSTRNLTCPDCRGPSYREVRAGLLTVDVCDICASLYLDNGEGHAYLLQTRATTKVTENTVNAVDGVTAIGDFLITISRLFH